MAFDIKKHLIRVQGGKEYLPVAARLVWFREEHPDWGIVTEPVVLDMEKGVAVFKATVYNAEGKVIGTGSKMETIRGFQDFVEKAETGAIGRALAVSAYGTQFAPELDEGERIVDSPQPMDSGRLSTARPRRAAEPVEAETEAEPSGKLFCSNPDCGREMTRGQYEYSSHAFGAPLCPTCQRQRSKANAA